MLTWKNTLNAVTVAGALALAAPASATTYDAVADFSTVSSTGVFSYGTGVTGTSFTPYTNYSDPCQSSVVGLGCWQTTTPVLLVPLVAKNTTGSTFHFGSVLVPTNVLLVHPGPATDSIVRFTVPVSSFYNISGFFELLDTTPSGVNVIIAVPGTVLFSQLLTGPGATFPNTPGELVPFGATHIFLTAGTIIDYGVNNAGNFFNDSTGLSLTFTSTPEPATWAMMLIGFGVAGAALRRKAVAAIKA